MFDESDRARKERANFQVQLSRFSYFLCCDHRASTFEIHWMHHLDYTSLAWNCPFLSSYVICCDFDVFATYSFYFSFTILVALVIIGWFFVFVFFLHLNADVNDLFYSIVTMFHVSHASELTMSCCRCMCVPSGRRFFMFYFSFAFP